MKPRSVNVSAVIQRRLTRLGLEKLKRPGGLPEITQGDARMKPSYRALSGQVETVISSPPYYGMKTYIADQWLRNWFVGGPPSVPYSGVEQLSHDGPAEFAASLGKVWDQVGDVLDENGRMYLRFGAIPSRRKDACDIMLTSLGYSRHSWTVKSIYGANSAEFGKRQAGQMGTRIKSAAIEEFDFEIVRDH